MRSPVNRRDPSGTRKIEREEIARQREILRPYLDAMAKVAVGSDPRKMETLERLSTAMKGDLLDASDDWVRRAEEATIRVSDRVLNNLHTGIKLGDAVTVPREEIEALRINIRTQVADLGDQGLKIVTQYLTEGYQLGQGVDEIADRINGEGLESLEGRAERIVRTETMRVCDTVAKARYTAAGCDGYMSYPTDDDRLCLQCLEHATGGNGTSLKVYGLDEPMALPWHPNCRCCRIPHFADQQEITI